MGRSPGRIVPDIAIALALAAAAGLYFRVFFTPASPPFEDAAMLMRYARHLAAGHGIVWNVGEAPVDGATDFLFLVLTAALVRCGMGVESAARALGLSAHLLTVPLVFLFLRFAFRLSRPWAVLPSLLLAVGSAPAVIAAGFGAPAFALSTFLLWATAFLSRQDPAGNGRVSGTCAVLLGLLSLVTGLIRPEGAIFAVLVLAATLASTRGSSRRRILLAAAVIFGGGGAAYFAWHWLYFGWPLPNPYYLRGGGRLYPHSLTQAVAEFLRMGGPFAWILIAGWAYGGFLLWKRRADRGLVSDLLFSFLPVAGFLGLWLLVSNEMNYLGRYQYAAIPVTVSAWPLVWLRLQRERPDELRALFAPRALAVFAVLALVTGLAGLQLHRANRRAPAADGRYEAARILAGYRNSDLVLATTEAGLLPLVSGWKAIDTWGLNDSWIAHHGGITEEYLDRYRPALVMWHEGTPLIRSGGRRARHWARMTGTLRSYVERNGYAPAAAFEVAPEDHHFYYIRADLPEAEEIARRLRAVDYGPLAETAVPDLPDRTP